MATKKKTEPETVEIVLSEEQYALLKAMAKLTKRLGREPTLRQLAAELGYSTHGPIKDKMLRLALRGLVKEPVQIGYRITELGRRVIGEKPEQ